VTVLNNTLEEIKNVIQFMPTVTLTGSETFKSHQSFENNRNKICNPEQASKLEQESDEK
jgi:hypothetical protein